ncbi:hypothetical protein TS65_26115 [Aneurinibacillus migulanus]|uniref:Uncharacterized protein n=1 Tax=Aneurinibacillus migulanus TaxID=47500 RepID=A0A0D1W0M9_ANEMI|nr:hypothetical protein TS65_26115 [Aneurinibacillus migulanus]KON98145.1 hypothetical protein AF333_24595 [Aneurinibacillus migulanus]
MANFFMHMKATSASFRFVSLEKYVSITPVDYPYIEKRKMHASTCSLVFFSQGRDTAALWCQGRTGKTSGFLEAGDSCRSISSLASHAPYEKNKGDARRTRHSFLSIYG